MSRVVPFLTRFIRTPLRKTNARRDQADKVKRLAMRNTIVTEVQRETTDDR